MGKTRMTILDVRATVANLRLQMLGSRCANVYDLDAKTYLIKVAKAGQKVLLLLESGIRFHSTNFSRDKAATPSGFSLKLRKHIRTKRCEEVRQLGVDRVVVFTFGAGEDANHVILELFAGGNIILTDHEGTILTLLRTHTDENSGEKCAVREKYAGLDRLNDNRRITPELLHSTVENGKKAAHEKTLLKDILIKDLDYGPALVEHALLGAGIQGKAKLLDFDSSEGSESMASLLTSLKEVDAVVGGMMTQEGGASIPGIIIRKGASEDSPYDDFSPIPLRQFEGRATVEFESLDKAMDAYFTVAEDQKLEAQKVQQQKAAISKVERVKKGHEASIKALTDEADSNYNKAMLIEANLSDVDNSILVVNSLLAQGMDWVNLKKMVKAEQKKGNPIAQLIHQLKLETNQITLLLTFGLDALEEEEQTLPVTCVDVDLGQNGYSNAQYYYSSKKKVALKAEKTAASADKAIKGASRKAKEELKKVDTKSSIQAIRKVHWFEKFIWFVSSENFLVVCGRDAQQNELLVKRYMDKGDIYLHADIHGAATHIVKNHTQEPVPPLTLAQAGLSCVCRSAAWDARMVTSAYWVHPEQVSKSAPTGEYLSTGSFMIRGKKNFLPPNPLVMGFGLLFRLDESSVAGHVGERRVRGRGDNDTEAGSVAGPGDVGELSDVDEDVDEDEEGGEEEEDGEVEGGGDDAVDAGAAAGGGQASVGEAKSRQGTGGGSGGKKKSEERRKEGSLMRVLNSKSGKEGHNIDEGTKDVDGIRIGAAVSMAAFQESSEEEDDDGGAPGRGGVGGGGGGGGGGGKGGGSEKRHLSAAERKKMKKGGGGQPAAAAAAAVSAPKAGDDDAEEEDMEDATNGGREGKGGDNRKGKGGEAGGGGKGQQNGGVGKGGGGGKVGKEDKQQPPAKTRGGNAKKKKIAKYADQDEDERVLAMMMLGHKISASGGDSPAAEESEAAADAAKNQKEADSGPQEPTGLSQSVDAKMQALFAEGKCTRRDFDKATLEKLGEFSDEVAAEIIDRFGEAEILDKVKNKASFLSGICHRYRDRMAKEEKAEIRQMNEEEGIKELDDDEKEKLIDLDQLTAMPNRDDVLHYCLPVCAPYFAMQSYKYKVKLTPGTGKKGKVGKQAKEIFGRMPEATQREKDLIKVLMDAEIVQQLMGNVRIAGGGSGGKGSGKGKK